MKKFLAAICAVALLMTGCNEEKKVVHPELSPPAEKSAPEQSIAKQMTAYEIMTMPEHPRLADSVASVIEFYKPWLGSKVKIVEGNSDGVGSILYFKKEYADTKVGRYEQHNIGEVDKVVCYFSKAEVPLTFEEAKPIVLSYFPVKMARENFVYEKGYRLSKMDGNVLYVWGYKPSGANYYKGRPPYGGSLTVAVKEENGIVTAFGMFYGKNERLPFFTTTEGYSVEPFDVEFYY